MSEEIEVVVGDEVVAETVTVEAEDTAEPVEEGAEEAVEVEDAI